MLLAEKSIRFLRDHSKRLFGYSKMAAAYSYFIFIYTSAIGILAILGFIYFTEPPTAIIKLAVDVFLKSPYVVSVVVLLSAVAYKIDLLNRLSKIDPHDDHKVLDPLVGLFLLAIGLVFLSAFLTKFSKVSGPDTTSVPETVLSTIFIIAIYSFAMFISSTMLNGVCRLSIGFLTFLLYMRKIWKLPDIISTLFWNHFNKIRYMSHAYNSMVIYSQQKGESKLSTIIDIFQFGMDQIEPMDHHSDSELNDGSDSE